MTTAAAPLLLEQVRVFDGYAVRPPTSVLLRDGVIVDVGPRVSARPGCARLAGAGQTLLPVLIDAHTHAFAGGWSRRWCSG